MIARFISSVSDCFYIGPFRRLMSRQLFSYIFCGGINFVLTIFSYWLAFNFVFSKTDLILPFTLFGTDTVSAHVAALGISLPINFATGFWLQRSVSFRSSPLHTRTQLWRYFLTALVGLLLNYGLTKLLVDCLHIFPTVSQILIYGLTAVVSFLAQRHFTFRGARP